MKYAIRSLKYFLALCVLCVALMTLMIATGTSALTLEQTLHELLHSDRYVMLFGAIVVLSALYPKFGFVVRTIRGSIAENHDQIVNAFKAGGFSLHSQKEGVMVFRANSVVGKLMLLWEDEITVSQQGEQLVIDGIRRGVARVAYRLEAYIENTRND